MPLGVFAGVTRWGDQFKSQTPRVANRGGAAAENMLNLTVSIIGHNAGVCQVPMPHALK